MKHFAGNDQEFDRYTVSTEVSRRALHEIYLRPFRAAVEEAGVKAVMTGYNPLNGTYCTENKWLIDVLKKDWGFKGMLMSDWACTYSADKAANNGLDLEMGSKDWFNRQRLLPLIKTAPSAKPPSTTKCAASTAPASKWDSSTATNALTPSRSITLPPHAWH